MTPVVFSLPGHSSLVDRALSEQESCVLEPCELSRFSNGELYLRLGAPVEGRVCGVLGSLAPPDAQMLSVLLLAHTLKREGARCVVAMLPYLGYARQDRADPGQSLGIRWAGDLLRAAGVDLVLTIDVHSPQAARIAVPLDSLSPAQLFAEALADAGVVDLTIVAPDEGARGRCEEVRRAAEIDAPLAYLRKRRGADGVTHSALIGTVTRRVAIVDDILDTGGTLLSACVELRRAGVGEIIVLVTHGLFTGDHWRKLPTLGVRRIFTTDSVPSARDRAGGIVEVLPVGEMLVATFAATALRLDGHATSRQPTGPALVEQIEGPAPTEDSSVP